MGHHYFRDISGVAPQLSWVGGNMLPVVVRIGHAAALITAAYGIIATELLLFTEWHYGYCLTA